MSSNPTAMSLLDARYYYLPYLIPVMCVELALFSFLFWRCFSKNDIAIRTAAGGGGDQRIAMNHMAFDDEANAVVTSSNLNSNNTIDESYLGPNLINYIRFERTFSSYGKNTQRLLYITRLLSFVYFFGISLVFNYVTHDGLGWHFFTVILMQQHCK